MARTATADMDSLFFFAPDGAQHRPAVLVPGVTKLINRIRELERDVEPRRCAGSMRAMSKQKPADAAGFLFHTRSEMVRVSACIRSRRTAARRRRQRRSRR